MKKLLLLPMLLLAGCMANPTTDTAKGVAMALGYTNVNAELVYLGDSGSDEMAKAACGVDTAYLYAFTGTNGSGLVCIYANRKTYVVAQTGVRR